MFRPKRAVNTYGKWKVIVNLPDEYYAKGTKYFKIKYKKKSFSESNLMNIYKCFNYVSYVKPLLYLKKKMWFNSVYSDKLLLTIQ